MNPQITSKLGRSLQFGSVDIPLHVVWARSSGKWAKPAGRVNSAKIVIRDEPTIELVREMEAEIQAKYPTAVLKSCLGKEVSTDDGKDSGVLCRMKLTKREDNFQTKDAWTTRCSALIDMDYGHDFAAIVKARGFMHEESGTCGLTLYANNIYVVGCSPPFGRHGDEDDRSGEPIVWR